MNTARLKQVAASAQRVVDAGLTCPRAGLTCLACGTARDFKGSPTVKEAMIQIEEFKRAHAKCKETR